MPGKTKTALAALFILGPVSVVVLAGPNNRTDDHGSVRTVLVSNGRTGVVNHAAKAFAAEEKPWFAPPPLVHNAPFCLKSASGKCHRYVLNFDDVSNLRGNTAEREAE